MYYDDFSDDVDSIWEIGKDENSVFKFSHGKYIIKGLTDSLTYHATVKFDLNIEHNFSVSVSATQWGNEPDEAYGINFAAIPTPTLITFIISLPTAIIPLGL